jgi:hypothetical protein
MKKLWHKLKCRLNFHKYSGWVHAQFVYVLESSNAQKPLPRENWVRACYHCHELDEKPMKRNETGEAKDGLWS